MPSETGEAQINHARVRERDGEPEFVCCIAHAVEKAEAAGYARGLKEAEEVIRNAPRPISYDELMVLIRAEHSLVVRTNINPKFTFVFKP